MQSILHKCALSLCFASALSCSIASAQSHEAAPPTVPPTTSGVCTLRPHQQLSPPPVDFRLRAVCLVQTNFSLGSIITPAFSAAYKMANPPDRYPREWRNGAEAFGRNYGDHLARSTASGLGHFAFATLDREDPRYYASTNPKFANRVTHALVFTFIDKTQSGHNTLALSNFAGAASSGFVGMAYLPSGYDDVTHAYQHAATGMISFGVQNLAAEFYPEIARVARKMHLPYPRR